MTSFSPVWAADLHLQPSRLRRGLGLGLHGLALLALLQAGGLPWLLRLALTLAVLAAAALDWLGEGGRLPGNSRLHRYTLWAKPSLRLREVGEEWWLDTGVRRGMVTLRNGRAWRWLVVMEFAGEWQGQRWRQRVVVWPDAVAADDFRRLRVRLRCGPRTVPPAKSSVAPPSPD